MQRRLHTAVDLQNSEAMASRGTAPYTIVSISNSCPDSFSHALMTGGVAPRKQDSAFWVSHKRKGCLFPLFTSSLCSVGFSFSEMSRVIATLTKKKKGNKQKKPVNVCCRYPPNKSIINHLPVVPLLPDWSLRRRCHCLLRNS